MDDYDDAVGAGDHEKNVDIANGRCMRASNDKYFEVAAQGMNLQSAGELLAKLKGGNGKFRPKNGKQTPLFVDQLLLAKKELVNRESRATLKGKLLGATHYLGSHPCQQSILRPTSVSRTSVSTDAVSISSCDADDELFSAGSHNCGEDLSAKSESVVIREVPSSLATGSHCNESENDNGSEQNMYLTVEPASPVESESPSTKWTEEESICLGASVEQSRPSCSVLLKRKLSAPIASMTDQQSEGHCEVSKCGAEAKKSKIEEQINMDWHASETDDLPDDATVGEEDSGRDTSVSHERSECNVENDEDDHDESSSPRSFFESKSTKKRLSKDKAKSKSQKESTSGKRRDLTASRLSRAAKYASNANAEWRVLQADEVVANAVSRTRLKQLVRELIAEHTQAQADAGGASRLFVKRISELMRERHRILILEGSVRTLIMQTDLVRLRSGVYAPFDGTSDVRTLQARLGEVGCNAMLRERTQRSQVESVLTELAAAKRVVRTRELMRTCRTRFRLPRDRYFYNHVAHKLGFVYNWNLQSWVRRGDDVSDLVGRLAKLNEELKGVAKVFANRSGEPLDADAEADADPDEETKPGLLVVDDQHVEMAVRRVVAGVLDKTRANGTSISVEELRAALNSHHVDAAILQNDAFVQFVFEEANFAQSSTTGRYEPQPLTTTSRRTSAAPKWFRCWLMNKILTRLFANGARQSVHYYELQAEALKMGIQLRLVRQVFLMYALDDFYMVEHRWVPIDDRFLQLLNATRDTLAELRAGGVQVTKAILLAELDRRGVKPHERGMPKLLERIGYTFSYLDHSYVPVDAECKPKP